jgi:hypothetical protein
MEKKEARVLNSIPEGKTLEEYFDSLDIFEKREMIDELKQAGRVYSKNTTKQIVLALVSWLCSFACYFGIRETWAIYYLVAINIPLTIFLVLNIRNFTNYNGVARYFEKKLAE